MISIKCLIGKHELNVITIRGIQKSEQTIKCNKCGYTVKIIDYKAYLIKGIFGFPTLTKFYLDIKKLFNKN